MQRRLESGTADERLDTLRKIGDPPSRLRPALEDITSRDPNPVARAMAADSLGDIKDPQSIDRLRYALRRDTEPFVRRRALISLAAIKHGDSGSDLEYVLDNDPKPLLRITALDIAAGVMPRNQRLRIFQMGINDRTEAVRLVAYLHLRAITGIDISPDAAGRWREALENVK